MGTYSIGQALTRRLRERKWQIAAIFVGAVLVQIIFLLLLPHSARTNDSTDFVDYYAPAAQHILAGQGFTDNAGIFASLYPPGYPLFLTASFAVADGLGADRVRFVIFWNILLMSLGCLLIFWTAEMVFNTRIALLSSALWITYAFNLWLVKQPNTEVLFIPLFYGGVYCFLSATKRCSAWMALICGFLLGTAALVRPIALLLVFLLAGAVLLRGALAIKQRVLLAAVLLGAFCITILPWENDVYLHIGQIVPLCTNGPSAMLDGLTFTRRTGNEGLPTPVVQLMHRTWDHHQELKTTGAIVRYMSAELERDPRAVLQLVALKVARSWFGTDSRSFELPILLVQFCYLALSAIGLCVSWRQFRERRYYLVLFASLVLYFWGMTILALSILRYMVPVMAYLLIPGGVAIDAYFSERKIGKVQADQGL